MRTTWVVSYETATLLINTEKFTMDK